MPEVIKPLDTAFYFEQKSPNTKTNDNDSSFLIHRMVKRTYYDLSTLVISLLVENINFLRAQRKVQGNLAKACFYLKRALEDSLDL